MAQAALRVCPEAGCKQLTRGGRCEKHKRVWYGKRKVTPKQKSYEQSPQRMADDRWYHRKAWRRLRAAKLNDQPLCEYCQELNRVKVATEVDHVLDRKDRPDLAFEWDNLKSTCKPCHSRKTARTAFSRRV